MFPHYPPDSVPPDFCTVETSVDESFLCLIEFLFPNCVDVTKLWFTDGLQPNQLWFETKTSLVEVRAYSSDSQSGAYLSSFEMAG